MVRKAKCDVLNSGPQVARGASDGVGVELVRSALHRIAPAALTSLGVFGALLMIFAGLVALNHSVLPFDSWPLHAERLTAGSQTLPRAPVEAGRLRTAVGGTLAGSSNARVVAPASSVAVTLDGGLVPRLHPLHQLDRSESAAPSVPVQQPATQAPAAPAPPVTIVPPAAAPVAAPVAPTPVAPATRAPVASPARAPATAQPSARVHGRGGKLKLAGERAASSAARAKKSPPVPPAPQSAVTTPAAAVPAAPPGGGPGHGRANGHDHEHGHGPH
jgi:hypothetical protein